MAYIHSQNELLIYLQSQPLNSSRTRAICEAVLI